MEIEQPGQQPHLLSEEIKYNIIFLKRDGLTNSAVAREILARHGRKVHSATVKRVWERYQRTGDVANAWNEEGRPPALTQEDRERLEEAVIEDRYLSCSELKDLLGFDVSLATINRELNDLGYNAYKTIKKPFLSESNMNQRFEFAEEHEDWELEDWSQVIFSDESSFSVLNSDGRSFVWRKEDEIDLPENIQLIEQFPRTILVWGAISAQGVGPLIRIHGTLTGKDYLDLFRHRLRRIYPNLYNGDQIFQDDNAPPHRAGIVREWFEKYEILRLKWPSKSPDLNIIEDVWSRIKYQLRGRVFADEEELWAEVQVQWNNIPQEFIDTLYNSLPNRMEAVLEADGGHTKY